MAAPLAPSPSRRNEPTTLIVLTPMAGSATSHIESWTLGRRSAGNSASRPCVSCRGGGGVPSAHTASPALSTTTELNTSCGVVTSAMPPTTGPSSAPPTAAPSAVPIICPRRSGGAAPTSHDNAPDHEQAPATPWTKRATSSSSASRAKPKARLETLSSTSATSTVRRGPNRVASTPAGSEPISVPAG
jgi:hypothetical protein